MPFTCRVCTSNRLFYSVAALNQHTIALKHVYCQVCTVLFSTTAELIAHQDEAHPVCEPCDRVFVSTAALQAHLLTNSIHVEYCGLGSCFERFPRGTDQLFNHRILAHSHCPECNKGFVNASALKNHRENHSAHVKRCQFGSCAAKFSSENELNQHKRAEHEWCEPCNRYFVSESALEAHLSNASVHLTVEKCPIRSCHMLFLGSRSVKAHCEAEHAYCDPCKRYFIHEQALEAHLADSPNHVDEFLCLACDVEFSNGRALAEHVCASVLQVEEPPQCKSCERTFVSTEAMHQHMESSVHKSLVAEPLSCPSCPRTGFASLSALTMHLESGSCPGGASKEMVDMTVMAADTAGVIIGSGLPSGGGFIDEEADGSVDGDSTGGVCFTPTSSMGFPTPTDVTSNELAPLSRGALCCPRCPPSRGPFINELALTQHFRSTVHDAKIYHCPTILGGGNPEKQFASLSSLLQHLESAACGSGKKTLRKALKFVLDELSAVGFGGVRLVQGLQ